MDLDAVWIQPLEQLQPPIPACPISHPVVRMCDPKECGGGKKGSIFSKKDEAFYTSENNVCK
jgi:hypothetical protein